MLSIPSITYKFKTYLYENTQYHLIKTSYIDKTNPITIS